MTDQDDSDRDSRTRDIAAEFVPGELPFEAFDTATVADLADELRAGIEGAAPDPDDIEAALTDAALPDVDELDASAAVRPGEVIDDERADAIVEAGGEAVDVAIEGGTVLVDTGGEVVEVVVENGGEAAAEATADLVVAALDGL